MAVCTKSAENREAGPEAAELTQLCRDLPALTRCEIGSYTARTSRRATKNALHN